MSLQNKNTYTTTVEMRCQYVNHLVCNCDCSLKPKISAITGNALQQAMHSKSQIEAELHTPGRGCVVTAG